MQYLTNLRKKLELAPFFKYIFASLFFSFTIALFLVTWKVQNSCNPLVGKSPCVLEHHSMMNRSWNVTKKTASQVKDNVSVLFHKSIQLLPTNFINK